MVDTSDMDDEALRQAKERFADRGRDDLAEEFGEAIESRNEEARRIAEFRSLLADAEAKGIAGEPEFQALQQRLDELKEESDLIERTAHDKLAAETDLDEDAICSLSEGQAAELLEHHAALQSVKGNDREAAEIRRQQRRQEIEQIAREASLQSAQLMPAHIDGGGPDAGDLEAELGEQAGSLKERIERWERRGNDEVADRLRAQLQEGQSTGAAGGSGDRRGSRSSSPTPDRPDDVAQLAPPGSDLAEHRKEHAREALDELFQAERASIRSGIAAELSAILDRDKETILKKCGFEDDLPTR